MACSVIHKMYTTFTTSVQNIDLTMLPSNHLENKSTLDMCTASTEGEIFWT